MNKGQYNHDYAISKIKDTLFVQLLEYSQAKIKRF